MFDHIVPDKSAPSPHDIEPWLNPSPLRFDYIILKDLRKAIEKHASGLAGKVLDYGCGLKPYSTLFRRSSEYIGADFAGNPYADILLDADGRLPKDIGGFDAVTSFQVLEHVPDASSYLSECARTLTKRRGKLLLTTHGIWNYHPGPKDMYRWTHEGLSHIIHLSGFTVLSIEAITTGFRSVLQIITAKMETFSKMNTRLKRLMFLIINRFSDFIREETNVTRRFEDFPIDYLCFCECAS